MIELVYSKKEKYLLAQDITEATPLQYIELCQLLHLSLSPLQMCIASLRVLLNKTWDDFNQLPDDFKEAALTYVEWVLKPWVVTKNLLPKFYGFYGPADELDNVTLSEFYASEIHYNNYKAGDAEALDLLIAVLYRKPKFWYNKAKNKDGDIRKPFNANTTGYYAGKVKRWPLAAKQAIVVFYDGCRESLKELYPEIFETSNEPSNGSEDDMFGIIRGMAGGRYGDFEKVEQMMLHTALRELTTMMAENKQLAAQINNNGAV